MPFSWNKASYLLQALEVYKIVDPPPGRNLLSSRGPFSPESHRPLSGNKLQVREYWGPQTRRPSSSKGKCYVYKPLQFTNRQSLLTKYLEPSDCMRIAAQTKLAVKFVNKTFWITSQGKWHDSAMTHNLVLPALSSPHPVLGSLCSKPVDTLVGSVTSTVLPHTVKHTSTLNH